MSRHMGIPKRVAPVVSAAGKNQPSPGTTVPSTSMGANKGVPTPTPVLSGTPPNNQNSDGKRC